MQPWSTRTLWSVLAVLILAAGCVPKKPETVEPNLSPALSPTAVPTVAPAPSVVPPPTPAVPIPALSTPTPEAFIPASRYETARLFNGFELQTHLSSELGRTAVVEKKESDAYVVHLDVRVRVPKPAQTLEELQLAYPHLGETLPGVGDLLAGAKVSSFYYNLYQLKVDNLNRSLSRLDQLLPRQNFYDCNTMLELTAPKTGRKALLVQGPMDVNTDGSDADRAGVVDGSSPTFQPFTSYRWPKRSERPSQFLADREGRLKAVQAELEAKGTLVERRKALRDQADDLRRQIDDLKRFSFLVALNDPYIVLPGFMLRPPTQPFTPRLGDYAVVVFHGKLYPALLGDVGPSYKMGEGSLRLAAQLNPRANFANRPVSEPGVTYLIFCGSAEPQPGPPDLGQLRTRCETLLNEVGGFQGELWAWTDLLASPTPGSSPGGSAIAGSSAEQTSTVSPTPSAAGSASPEPSAAFGEKPSGP
ncbi:MAG TPA: glycoside hydrolase family 75 protein [Chthoniobacterales bacterium]